MTLPASGAISLGDVLTEIRVVNPSRALPISLGDADVRNLAGVASGAISLSNLYGKRSYIPMSGSIANNGVTDAQNPPSNRNVNVPMTITVNDGLAPFTYAWSKVSGFGTVTAVNAATTNAVLVNPRFSTPDLVYTELVQCVVTDALGNTLTRQGTATLTIV